MSYHRHDVGRIYIVHVRRVYTYIASQLSALNFNLSNIAHRLSRKCFNLLRGGVLASGRQVPQWDEHPSSNPKVVDPPSLLENHTFVIFSEASRGTDRSGRSGGSESWERERERGRE